jgi:hypothetical protein
MDLILLESVAGLQSDKVETPLPPQQTAETHGQAMVLPFLQLLETESSTRMVYGSPSALVETRL